MEQEAGEGAQPAKLSGRFDQALVYASHVHRGQLRKGARTPYVGHLLGVAALVIEDGGSEDEAIAALLHDAAEDRGGRARIEDIRRRFGAAVAAIVEACSDSLSEPKEPWRERKRRMIERLESALPSVVRVSLADKLHNLRAMVADFRSVGEELWERFNAEADHRWYYSELLARFQRRSASPMVADLERALAELDALVAASPHPILDSYWVEPGRLLAGEYPGDREESRTRRKLSRLAWSGIDVLLDLTEEGEHGLTPYAPLIDGRFEHVRHAIPDLTAPPRERIAKILDQIDSRIAAGRKVYVHCFGGIGRTGSVVGCWLVNRGVPAEQALERIAALRVGTPDGARPSPETEEQRRLILDWSPPAPRRRRAPRR